MGGKPIRQSLTSNRKRVLRGVGVIRPAKRRQLVQKPCYWASKDPMWEPLYLGVQGPCCCTVMVSAVLVTKGRARRDKEVHDDCRPSTTRGRVRGGDERWYLNGWPTTSPTGPTAGSRLRVGPSVRPPPSGPGGPTSTPTVAWPTRLLPPPFCPQKYPFSSQNNGGVVATTCNSFPDRTCGRGCFRCDVPPLNISATLVEWCEGLGRPDLPTGNRPSGQSGVVGNLQSPTIPPRPARKKGLQNHAAIDACFYGVSPTPRLVSTEVCLPASRRTWPRSLESDSGLVQTGRDRGGAVGPADHPKSEMEAETARRQDHGFAVPPRGCCRAISRAGEERRDRRGGLRPT